MPETTPPNPASPAPEAQASQKPAEAGEEPASDATVLGPAPARPPSAMEELLKKSVTASELGLSQPLAPGATLEEFRIERVLGQGGFGVTYQATDTRLDRPVAIKEYFPTASSVRTNSTRVEVRSTADRDEFSWGLQRFLDEARTLARFRHPNIVAVTRLFEANGTAYFCMDFEEGQDFEALVKSAKEPLPEAQLVDGILLPLLDGLEKVHATGILHRDIKPRNIFIRLNNSPVLIDFGSARQALSDVTRTMTTLVSRGYSPFEQYGSEGTQGPWTDIYSLGGTFYRAIAGAAPIDAVDRMHGKEMSSARKVGEGRYSASFLDAIDAALCLQPKDRPQSVAAFREMILKGRAMGIAAAAAVPAVSTAPQPPTTTPATPIGRAGSPSIGAKKSGGLVVMGAAAGILILAAGGLYYGAATGLLPVKQWAAELPFRVPGLMPTVAGPARPDEPANGAHTGAGATHAAPPPGVQPVAGASEPTVPAAGAPSDTGAAPAGSAAAASGMSEDAILEGFDLSPQVRQARSTQIMGLLGAYGRDQAKATDCINANCPERDADVAVVTADKAGFDWRQDTLAEHFSILTAQTVTGVDNCDWRIDVLEQLMLPDKRHQIRTYCVTKTGSRHLEGSDPVETQ